MNTCKICGRSTRNIDHCTNCLTPVESLATVTAVGRSGQWSRQNGQLLARTQFQPLALSQSAENAAPIAEPFPMQNLATAAGTWIESRPIVGAAIWALVVVICATLLGLLK